MAAADGKAFSRQERKGRKGKSKSKAVLFGFDSLCDLCGLGEIIFQSRVGPQRRRAGPKKDFSRQGAKAQRKVKVKGLDSWLDFLGVLARSCFKSRAGPRSRRTGPTPRFFLVTFVGSLARPSFKAGLRCTIRGAETQSTMKRTRRSLAQA